MVSSVRCRARGRRARARLADGRTLQAQKILIGRRPHSQSRAWDWRKPESIDSTGWSGSTTGTRPRPGFRRRRRIGPSVLVHGDGAARVAVCNAFGFDYKKETDRSGRATFSRSRGRLGRLTEEQARAPDRLRVGRSSFARTRKPGSRLSGRPRKLVFRCPTDASEKYRRRARQRARHMGSRACTRRTIDRFIDATFAVPTRSEHTIRRPTTAMRLAAARGRGGRKVARMPGFRRPRLRRALLPSRVRNVHDRCRSLAGFTFEPRRRGNRLPRGAGCRRAPLLRVEEHARASSIIILTFI